MNNYTKNSNSDIPEDVLELVPWYAIGKLSVDDQTFFDKALLKYPLLKEQLEQEHQVIETISADNSLLDLSVISAQEERLKSVFNMIDIAETQNQSNEHSESGTKSSLLEKLKSAFDTLIPSPDGMSQYARVSVLVLSVAALTAFVAPLFTDDQSDFIPASSVVAQVDDRKASLINASQTILLVGFNGTSTELGNNDVLKNKLTKIETVPDKKGIYQISFKKTLNSAEVKQTLDALVKQKDLIWFAGEEF